MTQKYGLGRGLSSLIPQKNTENTKNDFVDKDGQNASVREVHVQHDDKKNSVQKTYKTAHFSLRSDIDKKHHEQDTEKEQKDYVKEIPLGQIKANAQQPRVYFDDQKLDELMDSIKAHGVLQPLVAIQNDKNQYELIAGERRLRASRKAGLNTVPVIVKKKNEFTDQKKLELALIENIQRHDLNVIEESKSYHKLANEFHLSQEEIARQCGKSRSVIANRMRLAILPIEIQKGLIAGDITEGHAKVILSVPIPQKQIALFHLILQKNLTVRQTEAHTNELSRTHTMYRSRKNTSTKQTRQLEEKLMHHLGTKVRVHTKEHGGQIAISYFSEDELKDILNRINLQEKE